MGSVVCSHIPACFWRLWKQGIRGRSTALDPIEGKYYDWPVGYNVGMKLQDHWKLEESTLGAPANFLYFPDGAAHKNRMLGNDFVQSVMDTRGATCFDCHDVHGTGNHARLRRVALLGAR